MIIGSGNIAKVLNDREGALFFAAGVSNSQTESMREFDRERSALWNYNETHGDLCLFYFGSISIYYNQTSYTHHKLWMEEWIKKYWDHYNIIRIGNVDWDTNPHTFLNALRAKKEKGEPFKIYDEHRFMINKEELLLLTDSLPLNGKNVINVFGKMAKVRDLL